MSFWPRMLGTVVCWFLSILMIIATLAYYHVLIPLPALDNLMIALGYVLLAGVLVVIAAIATLAFWMWVWGLWRY